MVLKLCKKITVASLSMCMHVLLYTNTATSTSQWDCKLHAPFFCTTKLKKPCVYVTGKSLIRLCMHHIHIPNQFICIQNEISLRIDLKFTENHMNCKHFLSSKGNYFKLLDFKQIDLFNRCICTCTTVATIKLTISTKKISKTNRLIWLDSLKLFKLL